MHIFLTLRFIAEHYSVLGAFLLLSYVTGAVIFKKCNVTNISGKMFLYTSLGLGVIIVILFYMSLFNVFNKIFILSFICLFLILCISRRDFSVLVTEARDVIIKDRFFVKRNWHWLVLAIPLLSPFLLLPLYPPTGWDELTYHLPYAKYFVENEGLSVNPFLRYPLYAHNIELLYALSLLFYDDILAHLFHAAAAILTSLGIYHLGTMTSNKKTGVIAACIFISSPLIAHLMKTSYIDLGLTLFIFLGFYCIALWLITKQEYWLYISGFAIGIAVGSKYSGLFYVPLFAIWVAFQSRKISSVMKFLLPIFLFGSPWYIRNFIISGDPVSPFGGEIFGYWLWNKADLIQQSKDLLKAHGTPRNLNSLLMLPWNLLVHPDKFMEGKISPGMVAAFPAIFLFKRFTSFHKQICIFVFVNIIIWFFTSQILRYLLPIFPMISLLSANVLIHLYENFIQKPLGMFFQKFTWQRISHNIISATAIFIIALPLLYADTRIVKNLLRDPLPVTEQMRNKYLLDNVSSFYLIEIANRNASLNIYQISFPTVRYFAKGKIIGDWFGPARYSIILDVMRNSEELHNRLRSMNIQLFLVNITSRLKLEFDDSFSDYFNLIAEDHKGKLYQLKDLDEIERGKRK
jgi:4-amino-4-deoxy-L-arabinose transferase-like glycosyltransferase